MAGLVLETPALPERGWLGSVLPLGLVPGTAPGSCLAEMIWSVIGQVAGLGQAGIVDREGEPASGASAAWTISAASAGRMVTPSRPKPQESSDGSDLRRADECEAGSAVYDKGLALC